MNVVIFVVVGRLCVLCCNDNRGTSAILKILYTKNILELSGEEGDGAGDPVLSSVGSHCHHG